jgi:hypothetical protein
MAAHHLFCNGVDHILNGKATLLSSYFGVEYNLKQNITKLLTGEVIITFINGFDQLKGFFDGEGCETLVGLFLVPGAAFGASEMFYNFDE